jgi:hypothetical protein
MNFVILIFMSYNEQNSKLSPLIPSQKINQDLSILNDKVLGKLFY